ncbi:MAG: peptidase S24, partial [Chloroflexi bacterium]|nr:peptidase S24 [Chloroflexota bacterium]
GADGIYVLRNGDGLLVKRLAVDPLRQLVTLSSDNASYAPLTPITMAELDLVGRVIWVGRRV